jgi:hypothetical protein
MSPSRAIFRRCSPQLEARRRSRTLLWSSLSSSWSQSAAGSRPTTFEDRPNRLTIVCRHCRLPSFLGKWDSFATSSRCHRWRSHRKLRPRGPYTANSGELPSQAGRVTPWPESPVVVHHLIGLEIKRSDTLLLDLISTVGRRVDNPGLMRSMDRCAGPRGLGPWGRWPIPPLFQ